jgi:hypothetical protein
MNPCHAFLKSLLIVSAASSVLLSQDSSSVPAPGSWPEGVEKPEVLLCADSSEAPLDTGTAAEKLVYGYIDSVKTPCMSETRFLELYLETVAYKRRDSADAQTAIKDDSTQQKVLAAIVKGEKNFMGANLRELDLMNASIAGANFKNADLEGVDLRDANLRGADFRGAILKNAFLKGCDLRKCRFEGADLTGVSFQSADLRGARGLNENAVKPAKTFDGASMDKNLLALLLDSFPEKIGVPKHCRENRRWKVGEECGEAKKKVEEMGK